MTPRTVRFSSKMAMLLMSWALYAQNHFSLKLIDKEGEPVPSTIYLIAPTGGSERLGQSGKEGLFQAPRPCSVGSQLKICPLSRIYMQKVLECEAGHRDITLEEQPLPAMGPLIFRAERLASKNPGQAAIFLNEAVTLARKNGKPVDPALEEGVFELAGKSLALSGREKKRVFSVDPKQGKAVLTPRFTEQLKAFQTEKGLEADGVLGIKTLIALSSAEKKPDS